MKIKERQMTFAYCMALEVENDMERVADFAWKHLSSDSQTACVDALEEFRKVTHEMAKFVHDHTDFEEKGESK